MRTDSSRCDPSRCDSWGHNERSPSSHICQPYGFLLIYFSKVVSKLASSTTLSNINKFSPISGFIAYLPTIPTISCNIYTMWTIPIQPTLGFEPRTLAIIVSSYH